MKIELDKFGTILVSRPAGKEAFLAIQPRLKEVDNKEMIEIDFKDVLVMTPSWIDEFLTPLKQQFQGRIALINSTNPSVLASLETIRQSEGQRDGRGL